MLGAARQVFGLVLYRGEAGLRFLFESVPAMDVIGRDAIFLQDALMLDWGAKKALAPEELVILAALGHAPKPRERCAWPCFRSHSPGLFPWFIDEAEARELTNGLRATLACLELAAQKPDFFAPCNQQDDLLPTVVMREALAGPLRLSQVEWRRWQLPPLEKPAPPQPAAGWLSDLMLLPQPKNTMMEFDLFNFSRPVADDARPYFPKGGLVVDGRTGFVYVIEMAARDSSWGDLVLSILAKAMRRAGARPASISIHRSDWFLALQPLAASLGVRLLLKEELPFIEEARASLEQFSARSR